MNKYLLLLLFSFSLSAVSFGQKHLVLSNPARLERSDELIVLKRSDVRSILTTERPYLKISKGKNVLKIQYDDLNNDGVWDEAVFLYSFQPNEAAVFEVSATAKKIEAIVVRAHVRQKRKNPDNSFGVNLASDSIPAGQLNTDFSKVKLPPFLTEGPAWENDKVGFRLYFDIRNGKDIWGKTTESMMMDTVGVDPKVIYHHRAEWGMDIYKVGSSLSAGALAIQLKLANGKDTLIRLGGENMGKVLYKRIADGPLRAKFRVYYPEWQFAKGYGPISLTEEISIWGGQYYYQSEIKVLNAPENTRLVTGFANLFGIPSEEISTEKSRALYSYGLQSENKDNLGLAILAPKKEILSFGKTSGTEKDIKDSYLVSLKMPAKNQLATFRFYSAWAPSDHRFTNLEMFKKYLKEQAMLYDEAIIVRWK